MNKQEVEEKIKKKIEEFKEKWLKYSEPHIREQIIKWCDDKDIQPDTPVKYIEE